MSFANADMLRDTANTPNASYANSAFNLPTSMPLKPNMHSMQNTMQARLLNNTQSLDAMIQNNKHIATSLYDTTSVPVTNHIMPMAGMYAGTSLPAMQAMQQVQYGQYGHGTCPSNMFATSSGMQVTPSSFATHNMFDTQMPNMQSNVELVPVESESNKLNKQDNVMACDEQKKVFTSSHEMAQRLFATHEQHLNNAHNMDLILKNHKTGIEQVDGKIESVTNSMLKNDKQYKTTFKGHKNSMEELWNNCTKLKAELDALKSYKKHSKTKIDALHGGVSHHKDTLEKMHTQMKLNQLENMETTDEHAQMISSLENRVAELSTAVQVHAEILDEHQDQLHGTRQNNDDTKYQFVSSERMEKMAPRRR